MSRLAISKTDRVLMVSLYMYSFSWNHRYATRSKSCIGVLGFYGPSKESYKFSSLIKKLDEFDFGIETKLISSFMPNYESGMFSSSKWIYFIYCISMSLFLKLKNI